MKCIDCEHFKTSCPGCGRQCEFWMRDPGHAPCRTCLKGRCRFKLSSATRSLAKVGSSLLASLALLVVVSGCDLRIVRVTSAAPPASQTIFETSRGAIQIR